MKVRSDENYFLYKVCHFIIDDMNRDGIITNREADAALSELAHLYLPEGGEENKEKSGSILQGFHGT